MANVTSSRSQPSRSPLPATGLGKLVWVWHTKTMPKRISKSKKVVQESTAEPIKESGTFTKAQISQLMAEMGRRGGKIGGKRRLETMSPEQRSQIALKAAKARWSKNAKP
jgi:hypothetical protein